MGKYVFLVFKTFCHTLLVSLLLVWVSLLIFEHFHILGVLLQHIVVVLYASFLVLFDSLNVSRLLLLFKLFSTFLLPFFDFLLSLVVIFLIVHSLFELLGPFFVIVKDLRNVGFSLSLNLFQNYILRALIAQSRISHILDFEIVLNERTRDPPPFLLLKKVFLLIPLQ